MAFWECYVFLNQVMALNLSCELHVLRSDDEYSFMAKERTIRQTRLRQLRLFHVPNPLEQRLGKSLFQSIPSVPGVYFFRDASNQLLYIGQSHDLKARIGSYRHVSQETHPRRLQRMVSRIANVEWQKCEDALAAVELERRLLLEHRPPFNRAGVWQGEPWWMEIQSLEKDGLKVLLTQVPQSEDAVAIAGGGRYVHASLMRCVYRSLNPEMELSDYPAGLFNFTIPLELSLKCDKAMRWKELMNSFLKGRSQELLSIFAETLPVHQEYWKEEVKSLEKYFKAQTRQSRIKMANEPQVTL